MNLDMNTIMNLASVLGNGSGFPAGGNGGQNGDMMSTLMKMMGGGAAQNTVQDQPQSDVTSGGADFSSSDFNSRYSENPQYCQESERYGQSMNRGADFSSDYKYRYSNNPQYKQEYEGFKQNGNRPDANYSDNYAKQANNAYYDKNAYSQSNYYGSDYSTSCPDYGKNGNPRMGESYGYDIGSAKMDRVAEKNFEEYSKNNFARANGLGSEINFGSRETPKNQGSPPPPQQNTLQNILPMLMNMMSMKPNAATVSKEEKAAGEEKTQKQKDSYDKKTEYNENSYRNDPDNERNSRAEYTCGQNDFVGGINQSQNDCHDNYEKNNAINRSKSPYNDKNPHFFHEKSGKRAFASNRTQGLRPIHFAGYELLSAFEKLRYNAKKKGM